MSFYKKYPYMGVDVKFSLFYVAWVEWNSPTYLENLCTQQEDNNEYQLSFQGNG